MTSRTRLASRALLALCCFAACDREPRKNPIDLTREHESAITYSGVRFSTIFELQANEESPLLVLLHCRGDTAENFREAWRNFPIKLQLSLPLAPLKFSSGRQWFEWPPGTSDDELAAAVNDAEAKLWPAIVELAHGRKVMIGGFSQGALVAFAMAARHPEVISCAFLIGGRIPDKLVPARGAPLPPILAMHGDDDRVIAIADMRRGIQALEAAGFDAKLYEYPHVGHTITRVMYDDIVRAVRARLTRN